LTLAETVNKATASRTVTDMRKQAEKIYENRYRYLVGSPVKDAETALIKTIAALDYKLSNTQQSGLLDTLNKHSGKHVWPHLPIGTESAYLSHSFSNVYNMALAYNLRKSKFYQNEELKEEIIYALQWLNENAYNKDMPGIYGNWFHFEISTPVNIVNILTLMKNELSNNLIQNYLLSIDNFIPDPIKRKSLIQKEPGKCTFDETGANLIDKSFVVLMRGVLDKNKEKIELGVKYIDSTFNIKKAYGRLDITGDNDGFYDDGSFIQHTNLAYTAGYGFSFLRKSAHYVSALRGTHYMDTLPNVKNIYSIISESYIPLFYKGAIMDSTRGRDISRSSNNDHKTGRKILVNMYNLVKTNPDKEYVAKHKNFIKTMIMQDTSFENYMDGLSLPEVQSLSELLNDDSVRSDYEYKNEFNAMNFMKRYINHREKYATSLSLFSDVISSFEYGNEENKKGFYQGAGVLNIYNDDLKQYSDNYYATIDMARLPGVTTDGMYGQIEPWKKYFNTKTYSGGATDGVYAAIGLEFSYENLTGSDLSGRKSWFFFDDEIVAVGSKISSTSGNPVETVLENRKLDSESETELVLYLNPNKSGDSKWAYLAGLTQSSGIGYEILDGESVSADIRITQGSWHDVNSYNSEYTQEVHKDKYAYISINHGKNPVNATYSYVILPNKTISDAKSYSKNRNVSVLLNSEAVHAVKENKRNILGINFFEASEFDVFNAKTPLSLLVKEPGNGFEFYISDPTMHQSFVEIDISSELASKYKVISSKNVSISDNKTTGVTTFKVDTSDRNGVTEKIVLIKK
jgi:hyaluronate lyase